MSANRDRLEDILERVEDYLSTGESDRTTDGPLHEEGRPGSVADVLSEYGLDVNATNCYGDTLLTLALKNGASVRVIRELLVLGASVMTRDCSGRTPLLQYVAYFWCSTALDIKIVRLLLEYKADVNAESVFQSTPLHHFLGMRNCKPEVVELLLQYGADVTAEDMLRSTPLHILLRREDPDIESVRLLLDHNADVNAEDRHRKTALLYSLERRKTKTEVVELLLKYGADVRAKDFTKRTPIDFALKYEKIICVKIMINYTLINKYDGDWTKVIDIKISANNKRYVEVVAHINQCIGEIDDMKEHRINDKFSLYDWYRFVNRRLIPEPLYSKEIISEDAISKRYPVYGGTLWTVLGPCLDRAVLLKELEELQSIDVCRKLGGECLSKIVEYLPNNDLLNFISALRQPVPG